MKKVKFIFWFTVFILFGTVFVNVKADQLITRLDIAPSELKCGFTVENGAPEEFYLYSDAYSNDKVYH